ncbi:ribosome small subunit-dependent GTPase A [Mariprofundus sp. NF]|uniref:ribosome small subunit-dependent GTPase A n=1 Tax=Mariprofundus sp. NF TaxID=2608716 RepID=UPI0015A1285D|nr:ribosome small subunit-dependent GTPase A [Mariprofundus sp. NF]NWF39412.1 ribosome small subunit-dependent GTPase A [Mariprofundus sp. NF]
MSKADFGLDAWFEAHAEELCGSACELARVIAVDRERFDVHDGESELFAVLTRKFVQATESPADFPVVGDWVCLEHHESDAFTSITTVLPRKTLLRRKMAGTEIEFQMLASNIDTAFIAQSCHLDFNIRRLERYLVMVNQDNIEPVLLLTKTDLITPDELEQVIAKIRKAGIDHTIIKLSNVTGEGIDLVRERLLARKTCCLLGSSGAGKTSLMNHIASTSFKTKSVSVSGAGRHTTVRRRLMMLDNGAMLIDMPGVRELGVMSGREGIDERFSDILALGETCRFNDCGHSNEPGCAINEAIASNELDQDHYKNYLKIKQESEAYEKAHAEKLKKGRGSRRPSPSKAKHKKRY